MPTSRLRRPAQRMARTPFGMARWGPVPAVGDAGGEPQRRVWRWVVADRDRDLAVGEAGRLMNEPSAYPDVDRYARDAIGEDEACADLEAPPASARSADGQDWPFGMARCQRPVPAVGDQVE